MFSSPEHQRPSAFVRVGPQNPLAKELVQVNSLHVLGRFGLFAPLGGTLSSTFCCSAASHDATWKDDRRPTGTELLEPAEFEQRALAKHVTESVSNILTLPCTLKQQNSPVKSDWFRKTGSSFNKQLRFNKANPRCLIYVKQCGRVCPVTLARAALWHVDAEDRNCLTHVFSFAGCGVATVACHCERRPRQRCSACTHGVEKTPCQQTSVHEANQKWFRHYNRRVVKIRTCQQEAEATEVMKAKRNGRPHGVKANGYGKDN